MPLLILLSGTSSSGSGTGTIATQSIFTTVNTIPGAIYSFSFWSDPTNITNNNISPQVEIGIYSVDGTVGYSVGSLPLNASVGRYSLPDWTCPIGITQVLLVGSLLSTATITVGEKFKLAQPMWSRV